MADIDRVAFSSLAGRPAMAGGRQLRHDLGIFVFTLADAESATDHGSPSLL